MNRECIAYLDTEGAWHVVPHEELIRCRDCKHYFAKPEYHWGICEAHGNPPHEADETDYCSWAERKEE